MSSRLENALAASNPAGIDRKLSESPRAEASLARTVAGPTTGQTGPGRRAPRYVGVLAVAAAVVLAMSLGAVLLSGPRAAPSYAATPVALSTQDPPATENAAAELKALADRAAGAPDDVGDGDTAEITIKEWSLFTRIDGEQVTSEVVPTQSTTRIESNGTATVTRRYTYDGEEHAEEFTTNSQLSYPMRGLSSEPETLARQLKTGQPAENGTAGLFDSVVVANRQMPLEPSVRAALLRVLAAAPDVASVGDLEDRAGRPGVGFAVDSAFSGLPTRYLLIFGSENGRLLGYEEMLTSDAGKLNVRIPSVIQYQIFESARYVD